MSDCCIYDYDDWCCHLCRGCPRVSFADEDGDRLYDELREQQMAEDVSDIQGGTE